MTPESRNKQSAYRKWISRVLFDPRFKWSQIRAAKKGFYAGYEKGMKVKSGVSGQ